MSLLKKTGLYGHCMSVSRQDYHETVISDILHEGDNMRLLNIYIIITPLYFILFH